MAQWTIKEIKNKLGIVIGIMWEHPDGTVRRHKWHPRKKKGRRKTD